MEGSYARRVKMDEIFNIEKLAEDNVRTLELSEASYKTPVCIIFVGLPASGKSYLAEYLAKELSLTKFGEQNLTALLAPRATITEREVVKVFQLAVATIEHLLRRGKGVIYDANSKTKEQRNLIKTAVEQAGGRSILIFCSTPKEVCYQRAHKRNISIARGEVQGLILDKDYFEYEVATTLLPTADENPIIYDSTHDHENIYQIATKIKGLIKVLEEQ